MFRIKILRYHTFRVVVLTSIVWMLFGFGVLIYYLDRNFMSNNSQVMVNNLNSANNNHISGRHLNNRQTNDKQPHAEPRVLNSRIIKIKNSQENNSIDKNAQNSTPLPPYRTDELKTWSEPISKDNPRDWPGNFRKII